MVPPAPTVPAMSETGLMTSDELLDRASAALPDGYLGIFALPREVAFVVDRAEGCYLIDAEGRRYIDCVLGSGPMILGHLPEPVAEALREQLSRGTQFYTLNEPAIRLAEELQATIPCAELIKFTSTGAEATFHCLRLARAFTGKQKILRFAGGYHGHHDYAMAGGSEGIPDAVAGSVLTAPFNDLAAAVEIIERHRHELAAVIVEPVHRSTPPRAGFLEGLRDATRKHDVLLVFDEVVTGFRVALGGGQELYGVVPDLAAYGKIIGGGLPLGAVAGGHEIMRLSGRERRVFFSGTLSGNPLAAAAGAAIVATLRRAPPYDRLEAIGAQLERALADVATRSPIPLLLTRVGSMVGISVGSGDPYDPGTVLKSDVAARRQLEIELARRGVFANLGTKLYLSSEHGEVEIQQVAQAVEEAARAIA